MPLRLQRLYRRYKIHHLRLTLGTVGDVPITVRAGRVHLNGAGTLEHGGARADGDTPSLPHDPLGDISVALRNARSRTTFAPRPPWRRALDQAQLWPGLALRILRVLPLLPKSRSPHIRAEAVRRLGLLADPPAPHLTLHPREALAISPLASVILILPVHNAPRHVAACLERIVAKTDLPWRLVVVDDGSTDPTVAPMLADWVAQRPEATLITHDAPRGFAGAVNAALDHLGGIKVPVILLNTDITLPQGWASRLIAPLLVDGSVASVTPLSNEGELMGAPHACAGVALRNGEADAVDAAVARYAQVTDLPSLPTGTGFCMALNPLWLAEVPRLDEGFGQGYGEEVDWCQRTRALGGRHVCQPGLFVGHVGAASFGAAARRILRARSAPILTRRWPRFDTDVRHALDEDPLAGDRLRAGLAWSRARLGAQPLPVYLAHSLGGGTARWLDQRLKTHEVALVLRVGGPMRWQVELHSPSGITRAATEVFSDVLTLLRAAGPRDVIYTCAVGDPAPEDVPFRLLDLCAGGQRLEVLFHDYLPLSRDYTFRSEPDLDWQALWRVALDRADRLTVFSDASRRIVATVHPDLAHKITLRPHRPLAPVPRLTPALSHRPVIGVPGHLNAHKGAGVVAALARSVVKSDEARIVVLGDVAPDCPLPRSVTVLGGYRLEDLSHLVARHQIGVWLIPSIWPETFSYATHEALATGLPTFGFDLGGQGDALRAARNGQSVSLRDDGTCDPDAMLMALRALPDWQNSALSDTKQPGFRFGARVGT